MKKVLSFIAGCLVIIGFLVMVGAAGSCEIDAICIDMYIIESLGGLAIVGIGFLLAYIADRKAGN